MKFRCYVVVLHDLQENRAFRGRCAADFVYRTLPTAERSVAEAMREMIRGHWMTDPNGTGIYTVDEQVRREWMQVGDPDRPSWMIEPDFHDLAGWRVLWTHLFGADYAYEIMESTLVFP